MSVKNLAKTGQYASIRNILQYKFNEDWAGKGITYRSAPEESFYLAQACEMVGDYDYARVLLEMLREEGYMRDTVATEMNHLEIREKGSRYVDVICKHELVKGTLIRLSKVFNQLKRNITAFVIENEDEYREVWENHFYRSFNNKKAHPWDIWVAVGVYENQGEHTLFFKNQPLMLRLLDYWDCARMKWPILNYMILMSGHS